MMRSRSMKYLILPYLLVLLSGCGVGNTVSDVQMANSHEQREYYYQEKIVNHLKVQDNTTVYDIDDGKLVAPLKDAVINSSVLDQGVTNTCVTFSTLAAMGILKDANSEYYSISCNLNLGNYLHNNDTYKYYPSLVNAVNNDTMVTKYYPSGWKGTTQSIVNTQINEFGILDQNKSCGNEYYYLDDHTNIVNPQDFDQYKQSDIPTITQKCSIYDKSLSDCDPLSIVSDIKNIIDTNSLALLSFKIFESGDQLLGLDSSYYQFDTNGRNTNVWLLSDDVKKCIDTNSCVSGTHDIMIFGYIDDPKNSKNGLLVMRNSWGESSGDKGNYYITYEYAEALGLALSEVKAP
jgi:C1A family cysteine protease